MICCIRTLVGFQDAENPTSLLRPLHHAPVPFDPATGEGLVQPVDAGGGDSGHLEVQRRQARQPYNCQERD